MLFRSEIVPQKDVFSLSLKTPEINQSFQGVLKEEINNVDENEVYKIIRFLDDPEKVSETFYPVKKSIFKSHYSIILSRPEKKNPNEIRMQIVQGTELMKVEHDVYAEIGTELNTVRDIWNVMIRRCCTILRYLTEMQ